MKWLKGLLLNIQFFTSFPVKMELPMDEGHLRKSIGTFPILGLIQGMLASVLLYILEMWTPFSLLAEAFIIWLFTIAITGGLHLDGWMDASDAYFSYQDKEKRLKIMQDSRTGAFAVISVIVLLSSRFLFIYEIISFHTYLSYLLIAFIPFLSKSVLGLVLVSVPAAKKEGLAALFQRAGGGNALLLYAIYIVLAAGGIVFAAPYSFAAVSVLILAAVLSYFFIRRNTIKWFGGITGDVLGASVEGTENILWMTLWLLHCFAMV